jgi:hypothetical protein
MNLQCGRILYELEILRCEKYYEVSLYGEVWNNGSPKIPFTLHLFLWENLSWSMPFMNYAKYSGKHLRIKFDRIVLMCEASYTHVYMLVRTRDNQKVTSSELLTSNEKRKLLYTKNTCVFKLIVNIVTAGNEAFVASGNKFLYAYVKEVCRP